MKRKKLPRLNSVHLIVFGISILSETFPIEMYLSVLATLLFP